VDFYSGSNQKKSAFFPSFYKQKGVDFSLDSFGGLMGGLLFRDGTSKEGGTLLGGFKLLPQNTTDIKTTYKDPVMATANNNNQRAKEKTTPHSKPSGSTNRGCRKKAKHPNPKDPITLIHKFFKTNVHNFF